MSKRSSSASTRRFPRGRLREAIRWYRLWGTWPVWAWVAAAEAFKERRFARAAELYRIGLEQSALHPAANSARLDLAYCLYREDQYDESLKLLDQLTRSSCRLRDAYLLQARIEVFLGRVLSAARTMKRCLKVYPDDLQALSSYLHMSLQGIATEDDVLEARQRLLAARTDLSLEDDRNLHVNTALAHFELRHGEIRLGERLLARVLASGNAPFEAVLLRGERFLDQGRLLQAREQLTRAMIAAPRDPRPVHYLARSYLRTGADFNPTFAMQLAQSACRLSHWQNAECLNVLARAYEANDQKANAQLFFERMKMVPSMHELNVTYFHSSLQQLRAQKAS
ncbi:MAG: tetratricopeptide repeat protein [Bdellovibrionales bacterium]|nr:tetratricopeptide repeat protein [Bdellovibrionales bacterium]